MNIWTCARWIHCRCRLGVSAKSGAVKALECNTDSSVDNIEKSIGKIGRVVELRARNVETIKKKGYQPLSGVHHSMPSMDAFFSVCEQSYLLLNRVISAAGGVEPGSVRQFGLSLNADTLGVVEISVEEESRYTTTFIFHQIHPSSEWLPGTFFKVRLYHDARMVEVLQYQKSERAEPSYAYPNKKMYQSDEKQQQNKLFCEWLSFCLSHGYRLTSSHL